VSAHLEALKTGHDPDLRAAGKVRLLSNLAKRALTELERSRWYQLIDWILPLPPEKEQQVFQKLKGDHSVAFITFAERFGIEQGERAAVGRMLRAALKAKFGEDGEALLALLPEQVPVARLEELTVLVAVTAKIDDLRPHFTQG
jgi:hypothetical protein